MSMSIESLMIDEPAEAYHLRHEISKGMLADYHESPRLFEGRYITNTVPRKKATKSMELGTLCHAAILEPDRIGELYAEIPSEVLASNGALSTKAAKDFVADARYRGQVPLKADDFAQVKAIAESVRATVGDWLGLGAITERTITWTHAATGLECRCKPDWIRPTNRNTAIGFDVKTTNDISLHGFRGSMESFTYWLQDAHYSEGIERATGLPVEQFIFVAVETEAPYRCRAFQLDNESRAAAVESRERLTERLAESYRTSNWADPWEGSVTKVSIRGFAFQQGE